MNINIDKRDKPLDQLIDLWRGIEGLHFDDFLEIEENFQHASKLYSKAHKVVCALYQYKIELEERT